MDTVGAFRYSEENVELNRMFAINLQAPSRPTYYKVHSTFEVNGKEVHCLVVPELAAWLGRAYPVYCYADTFSPCTEETEKLAKHLARCNRIDALEKELEELKSQC